MEKTGGVGKAGRPTGRVVRGVGIVLVTAVLCYIALGAAGLVVGLIASD